MAEVIAMDDEVWEVSDEDLQALETMRLEGIKTAVRHAESEA